MTSEPIRKYLITYRDRSDSNIIEASGTYET